MLVVQVNIFMTILLSGITLHACLKLDRRKEQVNRLFLILLFLTILILILEILSVLLNSRDYLNFIIIHKLVDTLGFTLAPLVPIFTGLYVFRKISKSKKINSIMLLCLSVPLVINGITSIGSYNCNWIFSITNENIYMRGPLWFISPLTCSFYYIMILLLLFNARKELHREELLTLSLLSIIPSLLSIFQWYYFIYLTIWNSVTIALVINYVYIVSHQANIDSLTGLGNRRAYDEYITILRKKRNILLAVVYIDLDDFKIINDDFGHHEGDKVLKIFAEQLEAVFKDKGIPIRFGGDEFIIFINENQKEIIENYLITLNNNIRIYNESNNLPYHINFSYGTVMFDNTYKSIDEFIQYSEILMYIEKKRRKNAGILI